MPTHSRHSEANKVKGLDAHSSLDAKGRDSSSQTKPEDWPRIQELREQRGITQRELAAEIGVTETAIANWENGRTGMGWLSRLVRLCQVLGCQVEDLVELESDGETIRLRIAELREQRGLSQRDLGRQIGGTATTIANWERGVSGLEWIRQALALCQALNCKISDLMKISDLDGLKNIQKKDTSLVGLLKKQKNAE